VARLRRKSRNQPSADHEESVALDGDDHAWWAQGRVNHVPTANDGPEADEGPTSAFFEEWSTDSLYVTGEPLADPGDAEAEDPDVDPAPLFAADEAFLIFGLGDDASWEDVVVAHRRLAKRYHPDRLIHASAEAQQRGEERMRELNVAYESLRRQFHPPTRTLFTA
jgi:hypothetical protein